MRVQPSACGDARSNHTTRPLDLCSSIHALTFVCKHCWSRSRCLGTNHALPYAILSGSFHRLLPYRSRNSSTCCSSSPQALTPVRFGIWRITADACYWTTREATEQLSFSCLHLTHPLPTPTKPANSVSTPRRRSVHVHTRLRACLKPLQTPVLCFKPVR